MSTGASINRDVVASRAQTWVDEKVPYSQKDYKDGYRTDCSGYVQMSWNLSKSYVCTTRTLPNITTSISKEDLQKGDILLKVGEHVTIFHSWVDGSRTKYFGYEESSTKGAVYREIPYPYFYKKDEFFPRKYNNIE